MTPEKRPSTPFNRDQIFQVLEYKKQVTILSPQHISLTLRKNVFIPDEGTFKLIEQSGKLIREHPTITVIADIGTGSGVIGITLAKQFPHKTVYAYDISTAALKLAKLNAQQNEVTNLSLFHNQRGEWIHKHSPSSIDLVIANPPFTDNREHASPTFAHNYPDYHLQPKQAIRTYDTYGTTPYKQIIRQARRFQVPFFLFRCNPFSLDKVIKQISSEELTITEIAAANEPYIFLFVRTK